MWTSLALDVAMATGGGVGSSAVITGFSPLALGVWGLELGLEWEQDRELLVERLRDRE